MAPLVGVLDQKNQNKSKSNSSNWDNHNMPWLNTNSHWGVHNTAWGDQHQTECSSSKRKSDGSNCSKSTSTAKRSCPPQNSVSPFTQSTSSKIEDNKIINKSTFSIHDIDAPLLTNRSQKSLHDKPVVKKSKDKYRSTALIAKHARARVRNNKIRKMKNLKKKRRKVGEGDRTTCN